MLQLAVPVALATVLAIGCVSFGSSDRVLDAAIVLLICALALLTAAACVHYGDGVVSMLSYDMAAERLAEMPGRRRIGVPAR